jgi:hypothetical protein
MYEKMYKKIPIHGYISLGMYPVYCDDLYWGHEPFKIVGIRENEIEIEGDFSGLMLHVAALTKLLETPRGPLPTPEESVVEIFKFIFWSALMALNDDGLAKDLIMVINKHAIRKS